MPQDQPEAPWQYCGAGQCFSLKRQRQQTPFVLHCVFEKFKKDLITSSMKPKHVSVTLSDRVKTLVSAFDAKTMILLFLANDSLMRKHNLASRCDTFTGKVDKSDHCNQSCRSIHTGDALEPASTLRRKTLTTSGNQCHSFPTYSIKGQSQTRSCQW